MSLVRIGDGDKGIIRHLEVNAGLGEAPSQPVVSIEIDLQSKWRPGRNAQGTQPKDLVDEIEVVMQALARDRFDCCGMSFLIVPGAVS